MAGGVWWLRGVGGLDRQSRPRPDRLPVRHPPAADPGKPDRRRLEAAAADARRRATSSSTASARPASIRARSTTASSRNCASRSERQVAYTTEPVGEHIAEFGVGPRKRLVYLTPQRPARVREAGIGQGFTEALRTPGQHADLRHAREGAARSGQDQVDCMGCLSQCRFSNWAQNEPDYTNGKKADPRSFCIQKTLAGHRAMRANGRKRSSTT